MMWFGDLASDTKATVETIVDHFGINCPDELKSKLAQRSKKENKYVSGHKYSFEKYNISKEEIAAQFAKNPARFGYEEQRA